MNTTIEFYLFELVEIPNFILNLQFLFFGPNLPQKDISRLKQKVNSATEFYLLELV